MITVLEALNKSVEFLKDKSVPNARFDVECLLGKVLKCARLELYLKFDHLLTKSQLDQMREYVARRGKREPLQYILMEVPFFNLKLNVDRCSLIPRPETEELIEHLEQLGKEKKPKSIIDLGTGTGAIALSLATLFPDAHITATDISPPALDLAISNAKKNGLEDRVHFLVSNWLDAIPEDMRFDWIISNPPYLTEQEWQQAAPEVKNYEPKLALVAPRDGLADLFSILEQAYLKLNDNGLVGCETGIHQHAQLSEKAQQLGYTRTQSLKDLSHRERFFFAWK